MTRPLFLRWLWIATVAVCGLTGLAVAGFASGIHGAPLAALSIILTLTAAATGYAGRLYWAADTAAPLAKARLLHDLEHVFQAVAVCQILGLIGAMLGYREITAAAALPSAADAIHQLTLGLGNGLTATLAGVVCSLILWVQHHVLAHTLEKA